VNKLKAYNLQAQGHDTVEANRLLGHGDDERDFSVAARMLSSLGVSSIRLMTNNPAKIAALEAAGVHVAGRVALVPEDVSEHNRGYLATKALRMGLMLGPEFARGEAGAPLRTAAVNGAEGALPCAEPLPGIAASGSADARSAHSHARARAEADQSAPLGAMR
jgi:hypothetical protein